MTNSRSAPARAGSGRGRVARRALLAAVAALLLAWAILEPANPLPTSERELFALFQSLGAWTYLIAGGMAFVEMGTPLGLLLPTELGVPFAGAAAAAGTVELVPLVGIVWVCSVLGDSLNFLAGRLLGRSFLERHGPRVRVTAERLARLDRHFERRGRATVVLARFGAYVRTLTPFLAGAARMPYRRFLPASIVGSALWAIAFSALGYVLVDSLELVADIVTGVGVGILAGAALIALALLAWSHRRRRRAS